MIKNKKVISEKKIKENLIKKKEKRIIGKIEEKGGKKTSFLYVE